MPRIFAVPSTSPIQQSLPTESSENAASNPARGYRGLSNAWQLLYSPIQNAPQVLGQQIQMDNMVQDLNMVQHYGGELVPLLLPQVAPLSTIFAPGYAGLEVFNQAQKTDEENADLSRQDRIKKTAIRTGDVALFHLLATIGLPLLLTRRIHHFVHRQLEKPVAPERLKRHQRWVTGIVILSSVLLFSKPITRLTDFILNWTYRPLLDKKRRAEALEILKKQRNAQLDFLRLQSFMNMQHITAMSLPNTVENQKTP